MQEQFRLLAGYNHWANQRLYEAAAGLDDAARRRDRGAFFGSIHRTLNHNLAGDMIWMRRFSGHGDMPHALDAEIHHAFTDLHADRMRMDARIIAWIGGLPAGAFGAVFTYTNMAGVAHSNRLDRLLLHFFNHQTHHRGQVHAMLSQAGVHAPPLDILYFLPESVV